MVVVGLPKGSQREERVKYFVKTKSFLSTPHHTTAQCGFLCSGVLGARVCGHLISDFPEYGNPSMQPRATRHGQSGRASDSQCGHVVWCGPIWKRFHERETDYFGVIFILLY